MFDPTNLESWLEYDEGRELREYFDSRGYRSIGVGHCILTAGWPSNIPAGRNLKIDGITDAECDELLQSDIVERVNMLVGKIPWIQTLNIVRYNALINMVFNLGVGGLLSFTTFLALIKVGDYNNAADDLLHTKVAGELPQRYARIAEAIRTGETT